MTTAEILTSRRILRQAERAFVSSQVSTFALRVICYYNELRHASYTRRRGMSASSRESLNFAAMDRRSLNLANRLPK